MYDLEWARGVWRSYHMLCPRGEQFLALIAESYYRTSPSAAFRAMRKILIGSIAAYESPIFWREYKKAIKSGDRQPLARSNFINDIKIRVDEELYARVLPFDDCLTRV